jgi:hypothetical protein
MSPMSLMRAVLESTAPRTGWLVLGLVGLMAVSACAKKPVAVVPEAPPLAVPVVPPRLVGPVLVEEDAPPPVAEAPSEPAPRTTPRAPRVRAGNGEGTPPTKPADQASGEAATKPDAPEQAAAPAEAPAPLLRTPETADDQEAIRRVREILGRAEQSLAKVNYRGLSLNAKGQHDTAKLFISQAEDALKTRSFTIARYYAGKAETIAGSLVNR